MISIIGAGNGGQAMAGYLAMHGHKVHLYNRTESSLHVIALNGGLKLTGCLSGYGKLSASALSSDIFSAVKGAEIIFVTITADAHGEMFSQFVDFLQDDQTIVLCPGRTGGALEINNIIRNKRPKLKVHIMETQSLPFACRIESPGAVKILGVKNKVLFSAIDNNNSKKIFSQLKQLFPSFVLADDVLTTSLENIGAILHPAITLLNAHAIERGSEFLFYNDMTPLFVDILEALDEERLNIGRAFGKRLLSLSEWLSFAYPETKGGSLLDKMQNNPAYSDILSPNSLNSRYLTEDIPTGLVPMMHLASIAGISVPLMNSFVNIGSVLLRRDFIGEGRNLSSMGLNGLDVKKILCYVGSYL